MKIIELNLHKIIEICKRFHVRKLWVFGSILTPRFNDNSDVDLCVDFEWDKIPLLDSADNFFGFQEALESLLGRKIDITDDSAVSNPYFREELNETRRLIYGYKDSKIFIRNYWCSQNIDYQRIFIICIFLNMYL